MGWLADLRRRLAPPFRPGRDDERVRLLVVPLEQRRVLSVTAANAGVDQVVDEGSAVGLQGAYYADSDPGASNYDENGGTVSWGDGTTDQATVYKPDPQTGIGSVSAQHVYADDGEYHPLVTVRGRDLTQKTSDGTTKITVSNVAPTVSAGVDTTVGEGSLYTGSGSFADPGADIWTGSVDYGDGSAEQPLTLSDDKTFNLNHIYGDNGTYTVTVEVADDDGDVGSDTLVVTVNNVPPVVDAGSDQTADEGSDVSFAGAFTDAGSADTHTIAWNFGDGATASGTLTPSHVYADNGIYTVTLTVTDDEGAATSDTLTVTIGNVAPTLIVVGDQTIAEGTTLSLINLGTFTDPGFDNVLRPSGPSVETFSYRVDWGDGTAADEGTATIDVYGSAGVATAGSFDGAHTYADNGMYTLTVTVYDDDEGRDTETFTVTVNNVAPTLTVTTDQTIDEGSVLNLTDLGTFTDPGFDNPLRPGGPSVETFSYEIDWGDGTASDIGDATIDVPGGVGVLSSGSFDGSHIYADNGTYTVTVTVYDDDEGRDTETFTVTVNNVAPTLTVTTDQTIDEGSVLNLTDLGKFTDPGFDNPDNAPGEVEETFTYSIDWGDGTASDIGDATIDVFGGVGVLSSGSFDGSHIYADNGTYTVTVTVYDDDEGRDTETFTVTVNNVAPTLTVATDQTIDEGSVLDLTDLGTFADPGFDNPLRPGGPSVETFSYEIDWGDGTASDIGDATIDVPGGEGVLSSGSFDGSHIYADNGTYTVTVTVLDDDGGHDTETFEVSVVNNVDPTLTVVGNQTIDEGATLSLTDLGTFVDPGFDNPDNAPGEVEETFTYSIDWGDGMSVDLGDATIDVHGGEGVPSSGSFDGSHTYADNGTYTVTVKVYDDDEGSDTETFTVTVGNVVPTISGVTGNELVDEGGAFTLAQLGWGIDDPGFDNPVNPSGATGETFTPVYIVDWGDGTTVESGAILNRVSGEPGAPTVADFEGLPHTYADNGVYTILITFGDDDSAPVTYALEITVANVAPAVVPAAEQTVDEGAVLSVTDLATFTDPGFDNPLRPSGPSDETFSYEIDWGDGTTANTGAATIDLYGAVGVATAGSFDGSHVYADNGVYTVTLTVTDDDGGTTVATTYVTVLNVNPTLLSFDDNDVNALGQVTVEGDFSDPGFDNPLNPLSLPDGSRESFTVVVDWADGSYDTIPLGGPGPFHFTATHTYYTPPDPLNPAADIRIVATVTDDDSGSDVAETYADVPGEGVQYVYIDTTPKVPHLVFPRTPRLDTGDLGTGSSEIFLSSTEYEPARADSSAASENYIVLRTVLPDGSESSDYRMPDNALNILPEILSRLPDNRYRVYEIQSDGPERLVRDVFVRQSRVIDQTDASEGIEERLPQSPTVLPEKVTPEAGESIQDPVSSTWGQWDARHWASPAAHEPASDAPESAGDETSQKAKPTAVASTPVRAGGPSALGAALLAYRLRAHRERESQRTRERFAEWGMPSPNEGKMCPTKPR